MPYKIFGTGKYFGLGLGTGGNLKGLYKRRTNFSGGKQQFVKGLTICNALRIFEDKSILQGPYKNALQIFEGET